MACEIKELEFENYGNCLSVSNGMIEAVVTIDVGPRIIYFGSSAEKMSFTTI